MGNCSMQSVRDYLRNNTGFCQICGVLIAEDRIQNTFKGNFIRQDIIDICIIAFDCGRGFNTGHTDLTQWVRDYS